MNIQAECRTFWAEHPKLAAQAHWRDGMGEKGWLDWGDRHRAMIERLARQVGAEIESVLEWGVGGGANAWAFRDLTYTGVDISPASLEEARQRCPRATLLLVEPDNPDTIDDLQRVDVFLCTTVIQHMHSKEAVEAMLAVAMDRVIPGCIGLVQTRWEAKATERYADDWARWIVYDDDEFRALLERLGWDVLWIERRKPDYSYHGLVKR